MDNNILSFYDNIKNNKLLVKISGMILGGAIGDSLGAPFEFECRQKYTGLLNIPTEILTQDGWQLRGVPGQCTDDTEMTLALWNSIIKNKLKYTQQDAVLNYINFVNNNTGKYRDIGLNTKKIFNNIDNWKEYVIRHKKIFSGNIDNWSQSNGALMRCAPLAIIKLFCKDSEDISLKDCELTNPHPNTMLTNYIFVESIINAIRGKTKMYIYEDALGVAINNKNKDIVKILKCAYEGKLIDVKKKAGWVFNALYCSFYSLLQFSSYQNSIKWIILQKGDTDTNACISGYLLGAYYGLDELLKNTKTRNNINIMLNVEIPNELSPLPEYIMNWTNFLRIINCMQLIVHYLK